MYNEINGDLHIRLIKLFKGINIDLLSEKPHIQGTKSVTNQLI